MKTTFKAPLFNPKVFLAVAADVSKDKSNYACEIEDHYRETQASNSHDDVVSVLEGYRALAVKGGYRDVALILEPTGGYERALVRASRSIGIDVFYANTEAVKKLQVVQDGTSSKSDDKDPRTILTVAKVGKLMKCRDLPGRWQALRQMNVHHDRLETDLTRLKGRARRLLDELFPSLDFCSQWYFQKAATAIASTYRFSPYAMVADGLGNAAVKLREAGLTGRTTGRIVEHAQQAIKAGLDDFYVESLSREIAEVYDSIARTSAAKASLVSRFESIYDELLESGEAKIQPVPLVMTKARLAMIHGETGPLGDFHVIDQLRKYAGMNLRVRDSGKSIGARHLSKKGRPLLRKLITQSCLPLVANGNLFAEEYHRRKARGAPGKKAMCAIASKYLNMIFGLHKSGAQYDAARVSSNESLLGGVAA